MGEGVVGAAGDLAAQQEVGEEAVPGDLAEADYDANFGQGFDLGGEVSGAVADLLRRGLVAGWSAADDGGDPGVAETEAVVAGDGVGLGGEAELVEDGIHEVAGAIAGEGAAGAVGTVGAGSEAEDEDAGLWVAEAGDGASPVGVVDVGTAAGFADAGAVFAQPGAKLAGGYCFADAKQIGGLGRNGTADLALRQVRYGDGPLQDGACAAPCQKHVTWIEYIRVNKKAGQAIGRLGRAKRFSSGRTTKLDFVGLPRGVA
jgi:hypothetical protein